MAVPMGMEFMNWQNVPSLTEALAGGKSPLLKTVGLLLSGSGIDSEPLAEPSGVPPVGEASIKVPVGVVPPSGIGLKPISQVGFQAKAFQTPQLPALGQTTGQDLDHDGQIDTFWGVNK